MENNILWNYWFFINTYYAPINKGFTKICFGNFVCYINTHLYALFLHNEIAIEGPSETGTIEN